MPMQSQVHLYPAQGVAGDPATPAQAVYTPVQYTAGMPIEAGRFCFDTGSSNPPVAQQMGSNPPLGIVQRVINYINSDVTSPGTMTIPEGETLTIAVKGDFWVETTTAASIGQAVFADSDTGEIITDTPGATPANGVATNWKVKTPGSAGDLIIISNWAD